MNPTRAQRGLWLAVVANSVAITGCQDSRLQTEIDRLQVQLKQADERVAVATAQIEAANAQVSALRQSLEQARTETTQAKVDTAQQIAKVNEDAAVERTRLERQNTSTATALENSRRDLAAARSQLDEIARKKAEEQRQRAALGVWEVAVGEERFRFAFYPDGSVPVLQRNPREYLISKKGVAPKGGELGYTKDRYEWLSPIDARTANGSHVQTHYSHLRTDIGSFAILEYGDFAAKGRKPQEHGLFVVNPDGSAKIKLDELKRDEFGQPAWYAATKVGDVEQVIQPPEK